MPVWVRVPPPAPLPSFLQKAPNGASPWPAPSRNRRPGHPRRLARTGGPLGTRFPNGNRPSHCHLSAIARSAPPHHYHLALRSDRIRDHCGKMSPQSLRLELIALISFTRLLRRTLCRQWPARTTPSGRVGHDGRSSIPPLRWPRPSGRSTPIHRSETWDSICMQWSQPRCRTAR